VQTGCELFPPQVTPAGLQRAWRRDSTQKALSEGTSIPHLAVLRRLDIVS
jgi:hypothetical protein